MRPDPDQARAWLESELAKAEYHQQGLLQRFLDWLDGLWARLATAASDAGGLSTVLAVALALVVVAVALLVVPRIRRTPRNGNDDRPVLGGERTSADEHRHRAEVALAEARHSDAVVEGMRALARRMVDRGVLEDTPGSTAHEIALAVADAFPDHRDHLVAVADLFDAVQYGEAAASAEEARNLLTLHDELRGAAATTRTAQGHRFEALPR